MATKPGMLTVLVGPMFSGKTDTLIGTLDNLFRHGNLHSVAFYHATDVRAARGTISSHTGKTRNAYPVEKAGDILERLTVLPDYSVTAIDEAQFFRVDEDPHLLAVIRVLLGRGKRVVVAGLDLDFRGEPFGLVPGIMAFAQAIGGTVYRLRAVCVDCGGDATMTRRLINGKPAHWSDLVEVVGGEELYQAVCPAHHEVILD